jgi:hypothetical protein|tara:strand:- start:1748 stop:2065 length:318 start_codon:yes stop_codon:yes gene_type:complete
MSEAQENRVNFMEFMGALRSGEKRLDDCPAEVVEHLTGMFKTTAEKLQRRFDRDRDRERNSPRPGSSAPDFSLELLDDKGKRHGEYARLSEHLDKPVALIFGSYT